MTNNSFLRTFWFFDAQQNRWGLSSNCRPPFDKLLKCPAFHQFLGANIENKGAVWLFQQFINLVDSDIAVFGCFPDGKQHFPVDRQGSHLPVLIRHRQKYPFSDFHALGVLLCMAIVLFFHKLRPFYME